MEQVTRQRTKISRAQNAEEFISPLLDNIDYVNNFGKARMMVLLGDLASSCSDTDLLYDICDAAIALSNPKRLNTDTPRLSRLSLGTLSKRLGKKKKKKRGFPLRNRTSLTSLRKKTPIAVRPKCCIFYWEMLS